MQPVVHYLTRFVMALVAVTTAGLAYAAYDFVDLNYKHDETAWIQVFGTNNKGLVVGGGGFTADTGFGWVYDPKEQTFTNLPPLSGYSCGAMGINNSGVIAGPCNIAPNREEGFILNKGTYTLFAHPGFDYTEPRAIGSTGLVTGFATNDLNGDSSVGFIYDPARGTFTDIALPGMSVIIPQGINAHGRVVGSVWLQSGSAYTGSPAGQYGFVRETSGAVTLFRVNGQATLGRGINDAGVIAGFTWIPYARPVGFVGTLASLGGFQEITIPDAELIRVPFYGAMDTYISAIDNNGRVVGQWIDVSGGYHGYIATPVPKGKQ
jgi:hypothetical protein